MTTDHHDLAAAYALDALEPEERRAFEASYTSDPALRAEVEEFRAVADELAGAVAETPPPALKDEVLARIADTPQLAPAASADHMPTSASTGPVVDLATRRDARTQTIPRRLLAAAAAVALLVVGLATSLWSVSNDRDRAEELATALADPASVVVDLEPTGAASGSIRIVWRPGSDEPVILAEGLADPGDGSVYELWALGADGPVPAGLFDAEASSFGSIVDPVDPTGWAVTIEPEGGSATPTSDILFLATT